MEYVIPSYKFHLAGIVPVNPLPIGYKMLWNDCLMPIAENYVAVERAVVELVFAGCDTIWIVANDDISPLIKKRLGDHANIYPELDSTKDKRRVYEEVRVKKKPIFYVPVKIGDIEKRDCLSQSILYGALVAYRTFATISKFLKPLQYYVAFPYGVYYEDVVKEDRSNIISTNPFFVSYKGKTVKDGEYLGFTFDEREYKIYRDFIKSKGLDAYKLTLQEVFSQCKISDNSSITELVWYYNIDSWEGYCNYLGSKDRKEIQRPGNIISSHVKFSPTTEKDDSNGK